MFALSCWCTRDLISMSKCTVCVLDWLCVIRFYVSWLVRLTCLCEDVGSSIQVTALMWNVVYCSAEVSLVQGSEGTKTEQCDWNTSFFSLCIFSPSHLQWCVFSSPHLQVYPSLPSTCSTYCASCRTPGPPLTPTSLLKSSAPGTHRLH